MVSFWIKGNLKNANKLIDSLRSIYVGPTLGGVETLLTHPATVTYYANCKGL